ncbi:hypothetical protein [Actinacidiphila paucisporea]|uniref:Integral membrane protein n=1 Tax=Actinacidiphila paucisporea TaxID=310782 RepID=A0A1M6UCA0_9ACTN|nr:hypothetical protein [Actinacidiphila paucisporea]SHK66862.1 hypothetical protein SAMN05216499_101320 [Actinacidiphila paucisporea]
MRRGIAVGTAVVLVLEALTIGFVNWIMGLAVRHQKMSLGGLDPDAMAAGSWVGGGLFALFLITCAVLVARIALRDRMSGRVGRIVLIVCAVVHGVVGAIVVGLVGWYAFVVLMLVLALLVGTLLLYAPEDRQEAAPPAAPPAAPGAPVTSTGP